MSLTSYRAAPPRVIWFRFWEARDLFFLIGFCAGLLGWGAKRFQKREQRPVGAAVCDLDCEEDIGLSLAGLAATYSPVS